MEKRPFIIDCDTGTDDAIAILAALGSDAIRVRALTSVNGNVNENFTSRNNRDLVGYLGADVEVARGAKIPFYPRAGYYDATHGSEGLGDVTLPSAENVPFTKETAPELIRRIAEEEEGRLELLVVGPMTNIAIALSMYPELKEKILLASKQLGYIPNLQARKDPSYLVYGRRCPRRKYDAHSGVQYLGGSGGCKAGNRFRDPHDHGGTGCDLKGRLKPGR